MSDAPRGVGGAIAFMARNPIAANLLMVILLGGGAWSAYTVQKEVIPQFQLDAVEVTVGYPGAAPAEVEQGILRPVEEAVRGVPGIREITSEAREGQGNVLIELVTGTDRQQAFQSIDQAISRIRTFPDDIDQPEVRLRSQEREVMELGLYGDVDIWTLRLLAERVRDQLVNHPAITQVALDDPPDYVTHVEIPSERLREHRLTLGGVAQIVGQSSLDVPAGAIQTSGGEILLRMQERKEWADELAAIEVLAAPGDGSVTLGNLATITDGFEEAGFHARFNGVPSVEIMVFRIGEQSPLTIAEAVQQVMANVETTFPNGVAWRIDSSSADDYRDRLTLLAENGALAVLIVWGILSLFLATPVAFWIMMGMAISFVGGIMLLPLAGLSLNMISMFGFLVVLGIVVDDAIIVGENVYARRQQGLGPVEAAITGARDIARPVTFSILTNIIAFVPLLFIPGETGKYWWPLPAVVILVLLVSLLEALFILPAHLGETRLGGTPRTAVGRWQRGFSERFEGFIQSRYRGWLQACLRQRYVTVSAAIALLLVVGGYGYSGHMGMVLMPAQAADEIEAGVSLPVGTTPDQAAAVANTITAATQRMVDTYDLDRVSEGVKTNVRDQNFIDVEIVMKPPDEREMSAQEVIELWRDQIGDIPGVDQITFEAERGPGGYRQDITVDLSHADIAMLEAASEAFVARMKAFDATRDVSDNYNRGKAQIDFVLLPEGRKLGLTAAEVGQQVRDAFFGALAVRQLRGTNEVEVRIKLPEAQRESLYHLEDFLVRTPEGLEVPLLDVVEVREGEAFTSINRRDGRRVVSVGMDAQPANAVGRVLEAINTEVLPELQADFPGLTYSFEGSQADMRESVQSLWGGFLLALLVIYGLLAVAFNSYVQPLIVMGAIPFGLVGGVIGHILLGYDLSLVSLMGVIALAGVVLNGSLIMVDYANRNRAGATAFDAVTAAGIRRFRPIVLTTLTTFGGLMPIILETSRQAYQLIPMAISLGFGIVFATAIILVLVPCLYLILEDITTAADGA